MPTRLHVSITEFCIDYEYLGEVNWFGAWHTISQRSYERKPFPGQERNPQRDFFPLTGNPHKTERLNWWDTIQ